MELTFAALHLFLAERLQLRQRRLFLLSGRKKKNEKKSRLDSPQLTNEHAIRSPGVTLSLASDLRVLFMISSRRCGKSQRESETILIVVITALAELARSLF